MSWRQTSFIKMELIVKDLFYFYFYSYFYLFFGVGGGGGGGEFELGVRHLDRKLDFNVHLYCQYSMTIYWVCWKVSPIS